MIEGYLTADQAAAHLGISTRTVYNLSSSSDDFPNATHVNRTPMWPVAGLDEWRANHPARQKSSS